MKKVLLIAFMLGMVSIAAAQRPNTGAQGARDCKIKLSQAPTLRGVRLGMTVSEVFALFPGVEKNEVLRHRMAEPRFGVTTANIIPGNYESKEKYAGVRSIDFGFLDGQLNFFTFIYNGPVWKDDDQLAAKVAESLDLPGVESWTHKTQFGKAIACEGFEVKAQFQTHDGATLISFKNLEKDVNKIALERQEAVREEARRAFKP